MYNQKKLGGRWEGIISLQALGFFYYLYNNAAGVQFPCMAFKFIGVLIKWRLLRGVLMIGGGHRLFSLEKESMNTAYKLLEWER